MKKKSGKGSIIAIVQARMGSKRLPGKAMKRINGRPMLYYCLHQLSFSRELGRIVLATSRLRENNILADYARSQSYEVFRGPEEDVLGRYLKCAVRFGAGTIVRITADEPLIDPFITDKVIRAHLKSGADYTSTKLARSIPKGADSEVISFRALKDAEKMARSRYDREHVTPYIYSNPQRYIIHAFRNRPAMGKELLITVDEKKDFAFVSGIIRRLYDKNAPITVHMVIDYLEAKRRQKG